MKMTGAEITIQLLERAGIENIAGVPGGANLPLYNALYKSSIQHILSRHEQGAGFIAQGIARSTGLPGVCFASSGPGATNLLTAIADAKLDSVPILAITGQVASSLIGTDAFQEIDTYGLTLPICKHNFLVHSIEELLTIIPKAFHIAMEGRPGPVVIDIPKDIQNGSMEVVRWPDMEIFKAKLSQSKYKHTFTIEEIQEVAQVINEASRPALYMGAGIIASEASELLLQFAEKNQIPVASTLMGLGAVPADHPLYLGMLGMHGARYTNLLMEEADVIIALGVRFDDRATGKIKEFCSNATTIHFEIDPSEINKLKKAEYSLSGDVHELLNSLLPYIERRERPHWLEQIRVYKEKYPMWVPQERDILHPYDVIQKVSQSVPKDSIITTDVGQHQMWVAQYYPFQMPRTLLTSGGLGTMGFGMPAAIGAALSHPDKEIICFSGDGSILMNIQELATIADFDLNIKVLIFNNGHLGLVRQQQELFYEENYIASKFIKRTDYVTIAKGFGIGAYDLTGEENPLEKLGELLQAKGPMLINIPIVAEENVLPMVAPGASNLEMIGG